MKECNCTECGFEISLYDRRNIKMEILSRGYKYPCYDFKVKCPQCNAEKRISYDKIPFGMKIRLFFEANEKGS